MMANTTSKKFCSGLVYDIHTDKDRPCSFQARPDTKDGVYCIRHCPDQKAQSEAKAKADLAEHFRALNRTLAQ